MHPMQVGTHDPEPLNLRQREVIALESIAKTLEEMLVRVEWYFEYARNR